MKHSLKTAIFKALDRLPSSLALPMYHNVQRILSKNKISHKVQETKKSFDNITRLLARVDVSLKDKVVLEIGSGWEPIIPFFLKFLGNCASIYTYDLNKHYKKGKVVELINYFKTSYGIEIPVNLKDKYSLPEEIKYHPNANIIYSKIPDHVDIILSRFVLEHVTPEDIYLMHKKFVEKYDKNTLIVHLISPSDHRAYSDKKLSRYDFLQYSKEEWGKIYTSFDYHNRLRLPQYLNLFNQLNFDIRCLEYNTCLNNPAEYNKFKKLKIHRDFARYSEEELTAGSINIVMQIT